MLQLPFRTENPLEGSLVPKIIARYFKSPKSTSNSENLLFYDFSTQNEKV